jgi:hypothetical protein
MVAKLVKLATRASIGEGARLLANCTRPIFEHVVTPTRTGVLITLVGRYRLNVSGTLAAWLALAVAKVVLPVISVNTADEDWGRRI